MIMCGPSEAEHQTVRGVLAVLFVCVCAYMWAHMRVGAYVCAPVRGICVTGQTDRKEARVSVHVHAWRVGLGGWKWINHM